MKKSMAFFLSVLAPLLHFACAFSATKTTSPPSSFVGADADELLRLRPDGSANDVLQNLLKEDEASSRQSLLRLDGLITKRRAIGKHLVFLDIVPLDLPNIEAHDAKKKKSTVYDDIELMTPVQAILRRDFWDDIGLDDNNTTTSSYDTYHKVIQPGVHVQLTGHAGPSRNVNEGIFFCHSAKYTLANDNPQHLRNVLRFAKEGALDTDEVVDALPCISQEEFIDMIGLRGDAATKNSSFGDLAKEFLSKFPRNYLCNPSQLMGSTNAQKVKLLPPAPPEYVKPPSFCTDEQDTNNESAVSSIANVLEERKQSSSSAGRQFTISGWVQNRRRYQGSITTLELVDEFSSLASVSLEEDDGGKDAVSNDLTAQNTKLKDLWKKRIYAVLHPDALRVSSESDDAASSTNSTELSETYGNILGTGARVMLQGYLSAGSLEEPPVFWATRCSLLRSSWRLSAVRQVLDMLHEGKFAVEEAAGALELSGGDSQAEEIAKGSTTSTERQWMAAELTQSLQGENSRVGRITSSMKESLDSFGYAREQYPVEKVIFSSDTDSVPAQGAASLLESDENPLRKSREGSRWQRAKKPQLMFMIQQIATVLRSHPEYGQRKLKVVDIGGGKGLLSNLLAETFGAESVEVQVVDISRSATNNGMMRAKRRGLQNIQFNALDATKLDVTGVDVVVALHACGGLSDVALGHAVCQGAGFVITPCCFRSNPHLRVSTPVDENGVPPEQWLDVDPAKYGEVKQLAELQGDINMASSAMHTICGLRAMAVDRLWQNNGLTLNTSIKTFPIGFSTRNLCLVGSFDDNKK